MNISFAIGAALYKKAMEAPEPPTPTAEAGSALPDGSDMPTPNFSGKKPTGGKVPALASPKSAPNFNNTSLMQ